MKNKFIACSLAVIISMSLCGCESKPIVSNTSSESTPLDFSQHSEVSQAQPEKAPILGEFRLTELTNDFTNILSLDKNKLLLCGENLYIFDLTQNKVQSQIENVSGQPFYYKSVNEDIILCTYIRAKRDIMYYRFDKNFDLLTEFSLNSIRKQEDILNRNTVCVSDDGNKLSYVDSHNLYEIDVLKYEQAVKVDFDVDSTLLNGLCSVDSLAYASDGEYVFTGTAFSLPIELNVPAHNVFGKISNDGKIIINELSQSYPTQEMIKTLNYTFFPEDFTKATGKLLVQSNKDESIKIHSLGSNKESKFAISSSICGNFFATLCFTQSDVIVKVYDTKSGECIKEVSYTNNDAEIFSFRHKLFLMDDSRTATFVLGIDAKDTAPIIYTFSF